MLEDLQALGMKLEPFLPVDGTTAGQLWAPTRQLGLSLSDRACLSNASPLRSRSDHRQVGQ